MNWSVVITTRDRAVMLQRVIESCFNQSLPCEVVIVDEASSSAVGSRSLSARHRHHSSQTAGVRHLPLPSGWLLA